MSIGQFALGEAAIAQANPLASAKKTPTKRQIRAVIDPKLMPEPR